MISWLSLVSWLALGTGQFDMALPLPVRVKSPGNNQEFFISQETGAGDRAASMRQLERFAGGAFVQGMVVMRWDVVVEMGDGVGVRHALSPR